MLNDLAWRRLLKEYGVREVQQTRSLNAQEFRLVRDDDVVTFHVLDEELIDLKTQADIYRFLKELITRALCPPQ